MFLRAETDFGLKLLNTLPVQNESLAFSPLSIALVLSLVHTGARGKSKDQIEDVLLNGASDDQFVNHFSFLSESLKNSESGAEVYVANRVYLKRGFTANPTFLSVALKNYGADAQTLDFTTLTAARKINTFVAEATKGKITETVTRDFIKNSVALLINALYFKADWYDDFDPFSVVDQDFTTYSGAKKSLKFIRDSMSDRHYSSDDVFQVLQLPYKNENYKFIIFLPKQRNTLSNSLAKMDSRRFQFLLNNATRIHLNTQFPKFKEETKLDIKQNLEALGITEIFTDSANLAGLADNIKISDVVHKTIIEVDEKGTTAAAVSMPKMVPMSGRIDEPTNFIADHPFLYSLTYLNHPLFLGVFHG